MRLVFGLRVLHSYHCREAEWFGVYCESAWQNPVLPADPEAAYSPFLVLQPDAAVAVAWEAYGQPEAVGRGWRGTQPARAVRPVRCQPEGASRGGRRREP